MSELAPLTQMQKVIPPRLLVPYLAGQRTIISGYVYRVQDCSRLDGPEQLVSALDLTFEGSELDATVPEVYVLRWQVRDTDTYVVPYGQHMGGDWNDSPPFAGNGFTTSRRHVVPQFHTPPMPIPAGAEIRHITARGERGFAAFDGLTWRRAA
ncbi:hypothetical protein GCM10009677_28170 [Sphaerisporangium rubeum]|uniref:Uncharacterized protein n=1 Tax=Sphaerisporangium rubeum TaxID=321317 RepID=A0A7X0M7J9_9ACTN|nr:hypothetical protein [Sphaerisporangium rubeum]